MLVTTVLCWIFIVKFQQKNLPVLFVRLVVAQSSMKAEQVFSVPEQCWWLQAWEGALLLKLKQIITVLPTVLSKDAAEDLHH